MTSWFSTHCHNQTRPYQRHPVHEYRCAGNDFYQMDSRKVLGLVCLLLFSFLIIQYFQFFNTGKAFFTFSHGDDRVTDGDVNVSPLSKTNPWSPSGQNGDDSKSINSLLGPPTPAAPDSSTGGKVDRVTGGVDGRISSQKSFYEIDSSPPSIPIPESGKEITTALRPATPAAAPADSGNSTDVRISGDQMLSKSDREDVNVVAAVVENANDDRNVAPIKPPTTAKQVSGSSNVVSISEMNDMLVRSRAKPLTKSPLWSWRVDQELVDARFQIEHAPIFNAHPILHAPLYRNLSTFLRSYEKMEQTLKVFVYKDGESPVFHKPKLGGIYASEGWFMKHMEASKKFRTTKPEEAHLFYLPYSSQALVSHVYVPDSHTFHDIIRYLKNYLDTINGKYPFWNRTDGADHFLVACHDWAPMETRLYMSNCIRAMCNADVKEGFQFGKDVSLPETVIHSAKNPMKRIGGKSPSARTTLAFFAGRMHGHVRPILLKHWENKDPDMKIFGKVGKKSYISHMKSSKYCVCAKGYEVNSPRVVEAILYGCVPVIISDNFVPPFFDVLNWDLFAVFVAEKDILELKKILESIPEEKYVLMQKRVEQVRLHFVWHNKPERYDIFHMILHSVWYNRVMRMSIT